MITGNIQLNRVSELKILGVKFNKTLKWNSHITNMTKDLIQHFNIMKCLASLKFNTGTIVIINATKALIISKIRHTGKTSLKKN